MSKLRISRRALMRASLLTGAGLAFPALARARDDRPFVPAAGWLDGEPPELDLGQSFGVAWPRGSRFEPGSLAGRDESGRSIAMQSWVTGYWPDGSIKWTGHATQAGVRSRHIRIVRNGPVASEAPVTVMVIEHAGDIEVRQGGTVWKIPKSGDAIIASASRGGREVLGPVSAVSLLADNPEGSAPAPLKPRTSRVTVEQKGPVRAVVRVEGVHSETAPQFPFSIRLYFSAGTDCVRIVHSFVHDGRPGVDYLAGIGLTATAKLDAAAFDRHVRFGLTEKRLFAEAAMPLTGLRRDPGEAFRTAQADGKRAPPAAQMNEAVRSRLDAIPVWNDFRLLQSSANGAVLQKRTGRDHAWIDSDETTRAPGFASLSSPDGGVALSLRYFWQRHPASLEVAGLGSSVSSLTAWLWSPDAAPMDMRSYRGVMGMEGYDAQNDGLAVTYEDYEPGWDDARGIARTSEMVLWALDATPDAEQAGRMLRAGAEPPRLIADPSALHAAEVLGVWSLPDRSTPARSAIERQLENLVDFYAGEVDRRSWYGFWDHGDVMHAYDWDRSQWRYDIGGYAWDNSELSTDLWLWYQALRTRDARTFRLAEAMTRHTGEVDVYHLGRFKGLGTRHGVQHFSDSSKQPRISTAVYRRMFYYLTTDERTGDLMRDLLGSEERLLTVEIGRKVPGRKKLVLPDRTVEMSFGTVWCSLAAAWLTEWERTGDRSWRDRLLAGMTSIAKLPRGWMTGSAAFDLDSGRFQPRDAINVSHLNAVFGAVEINAELLQLIEAPDYRKAWLDYCIYYNAPREEFRRRFGVEGKSFNLAEGHSRLTAFAARSLGDAALATRAAREFYSGEAGLGIFADDPRTTSPDGTVEWPGISTNSAAQWGLAAIENLALIPGALDREFATAPIVRRPG